MKSEAVSFALIYIQEQEKSVIDNLEKVIVISSYGHRYCLKPDLLRVSIEKVKKFPFPDPDNLLSNFEEIKNNILFNKILF
jgi:hypothetical protein